MTFFISLFGQNGKRKKEYILYNKNIQNYIIKIHQWKKSLQPIDVITINHKCL